jgi:shikimate kinase
LSGVKVCFVGQKGVGKSTLSRILASDLGLKHLDVDEQLVAKHSVNNIRELYILMGEESFRRVEYDCLTQLNQHSIISPGGGILEYHLSMYYIRTNYTVIWIKQSFEDWFSQFKLDTKYLGQINTKDQLKHIFSRRELQYKKCADILLEKKTKTDMCELLEECKHQLLL